MKPIFFSSQYLDCEYYTPGLLVSYEVAIFHLQITLFRPVLTGYF